jgi:uncharacterized membrane protein YcaP (DUF421 family)
MGLLQIGVRALIVGAYLLVVTRASGKRVITQATPFDFIVALIIGDLVDNALWSEVSLAAFAAAAGSIIVVDLILKIVAFRSDRFFTFINGKSSIVLRDGVADQQSLRHEQLTEEDVDEFLRLDGIADRREVKLAVIEEAPKLSILKQWRSSPVQKKDREAVT